MASGADSPYTRTYYDVLHAGATRSADAVLRTLLPLLAPRRPRSVVDVGCGEGVWLTAALQLGIEDAWGIDGPWVDRGRLPIPSEHFIVADLSATGSIEPPRVDLAICLETAEHLPEQAARPLVALLAAAAPVVLFSAAIPGQAGTGHVNEQWPDYWSRLFAERGFAASDPIRPRLWRNPGVDWWYLQNTLVFVSREDLVGYPGLRESAVDDPQPLVHPRLWIRHHVEKCLRR